MEMEMYSVYDRKLRQYGGIFLARSLGALGRELVVGVRGSNSMMEKFPEDFELHRLGVFDQETGIVDPVDGRPVVITTLDVILEVPIAQRANAVSGAKSVLDGAAE